MLTHTGGEKMYEDKKKAEKLEENKVDTEFGEDQTGEKNAVKKVQNVIFEMHSQAGYYNKEKE